MNSLVNYQTPNVLREIRQDGSVLLSSGLSLGPVAKTTGEWLHQWSDQTLDAMKFVDADDPNKGMRFDGRISEDFKLQTGTWARASSLCLEVLTCLAPLAADVIITGQDRAEIGVMIFPDHEAIQEADYDLQSDKGTMNCELLLSDIARRLTEFDGRSSGSSTRVARALVLAEPPSIADGEITAKGNLNFRKVITGRADLLERLYDDNDTVTIKIL